MTAILTLANMADLVLTESIVMSASVSPATMGVTVKPVSISRYNLNVTMSHSKYNLKVQGGVKFTKISCLL